MSTAHALGCVSSTVAAMSPHPHLDALPPELTEKFATYLKDDDGDWIPQAFFSLRLTCKDVNFKTFQLFGSVYFKNISVAFTSVSLQRLRDVLYHRNSFAQSLSTFPRSLDVSAYRLLWGDGVDKRHFTPSEGPNKSYEISHMRVKKSSMALNLLANTDYTEANQLGRTMPTFKE